MSKDLDINMRGHEEPVDGKRRRNQTKFHLDEVVAEFEKKTSRAKKQATPPANHHFGVAFRSFPGLVESPPPSGGFPAMPEPVPRFSVQNNAGHFHYYQQFMAPAGSAGIPEPAAYHVLSRPSKLLPYCVVSNPQEKPAMPVVHVSLPQSNLSGRVRHPDDPESDSDLPIAIAKLIDVVQPAASVDTESDNEPGEDIPVASGVVESQVAVGVQVASEVVESQMAVGVQVASEVVESQVVVGAPVASEVVESQVAVGAPVASETFLFNELIPGGEVMVIDGLLDAVGLVQLVTGSDRNYAGEILRNMIKEQRFPSDKIIIKRAGKS